jgi:hypothetical protein
VWVLDRGSFGQVVQVSLETVRLVAALPKEYGG